MPVRWVVSRTNVSMAASRPSWSSTLGRSSLAMRRTICIVWSTRSASDASPSRKMPESVRSEEHTSELQSRLHLVCRLLLEKKNHSKSRRAGKPLVKLNCAAFPQTMIESELFGYVKGAFTVAMNDFPGMIAEARGGTLFLDEISEMPADLQTRFLRVLQGGEYRSLGSTRILKADFRVITATNRPIGPALAEKRLRSDLYYRINTFQIEVPPLRERKEDIPPLVTTFVQRFAAQLGKAEPTIAPEAFQKLLDYSWPG